MQRDDEDLHLLFTAAGQSDFFFPPLAGATWYFGFLFGRLVLRRCRGGRSLTASPTSQSPAVRMLAKRVDFWSVKCFDKCLQHVCVCESVSQDLHLLCPNHHHPGDAPLCRLESCDLLRTGLFQYLSSININIDLQQQDSLLVCPAAAVGASQSVSKFRVCIL